MLPTSVFGNDLFVFDYAKDDELIYLNAALTAEAAIAIAINNSEFSFLKYITSHLQTQLIYFTKNKFSQIPAMSGY